MGVPEEVGFATKGELARRMLSRAFEAGVPAAWVTGDEVYGNDGKLRRWLEARRRPYVLAVARSHPLMAALRCKRAEEVVAEAPPEAWQRVEVGAGSKGPRVYDWAKARLPYESAEGRAQWLLARRSVSQPEELAYYRAYGPEEATVEELAKVAGSRWSIEEGFERAKGEVGLDHYEVRYWDSWHRHITLCLLAHAFLEVTRAAANGETGSEATAPGKRGGANPAHSPGSTPIITHARTASRGARLSAALVKVASKTAGRCAPLSLQTPDGTRCPERRSAVVELVGWLGAKCYARSLAGGGSSRERLRNPEIDAGLATCPILTSKLRR